METLKNKIAKQARIYEDYQGNESAILGAVKSGKFHGFIAGAEWATAQLKADKAELLEALENSRKVIEWYMENTMPESDNHTDFFNIGMNQRTEIESLIQKHKQ